MANISIKKDFKDGDKLLAQQLNNNFSVIEAGVNANDENLETVIKDAEARLKAELESITADRGWDWNEGDRVTFFKGSEEEVANQEVKDGQLLYNETTGETYLDNEGKRIVTGSGNVVSIGSEEPTNNATKIWIDPEEIGEPLPHQLVVSPEEPATGEEVWIKKSDNYLDTRAFVNETKNGLTLTYNNGLFTITGKATASTPFLIDYILSNLVIGETYTLSAIGDTTGITNFGFKSAGGGDRFIVDNGVSKTVEMTQYIISEVGRFDFYIGSGQTVNASFYVQLTQGEEIPETYTPYVDKEIYVKNDNGVYELFSKNENTSIVTNQLMPTNEYIDGKRVYVKRFNYGALPNATYKRVETDLLRSEFNLEKMIGKATNGSYNVNLPSLSLIALENCMTLGGIADTSSKYICIEIQTGIDRSSWTAIVDVYVTKK